MAGATRWVMSAMVAVCAACAGMLVVSVSPGLAATTTTYPNVVFSDGFESGSLNAWNGALGTGWMTVAASAAHGGSYGAQISNGLGQYGLLVKSMPSGALPDSQVSFWVKVASGGGVQSLAEARGNYGSRIMWGLLYDGSSQALYFYPYSESGSKEIYTGAGTVPANTWVQITVQYTATASGGAQLYINGQTSPAWGVSGDYTRSAYVDTLQLWDDGTAATDFDDVQVSAPAPATVQRLVPPSAPSNVQGTPSDGAVDVAWTAPASNGGNPITGYRITPYIGTTAQPAILTGSTSTNYYVSGLNDGTAYTFTVAAVNGIGTGAASTPSAPITPVAASSKYTNLVFADGFESGSLSAWSGAAGNGSVTVAGAAAHGGADGLQIVNAAGQYGLIAKSLPRPLADSSVSFWVKLAPGDRVQTLAEARDAASSQTMWGLLYDGTTQALYFYPYSASGSTEIYTGAGSVPANTWVEVEIQYTAAADGGAKLYIDGQTTPAWDVSGDYRRSADLQKLQLWDDTTAETDFDDVDVASPPTPALSLSASSVDLGYQSVGGAGAAKTVTVTNTGNAPDAITGIALAGSNPGDFAQTNNCPTAPATLAAKASCSVSVSLVPTVSGARSASLQITGDAGASVALSGVGTAPAVTLSSQSATWPDTMVGQTSSLTMSLQNTGNAPLSLTGLTIAGANAAEFSAINGSCFRLPTTVAAGASCTIIIQFAPTGLGERSASLSLADNAGDSPQTLLLRGNALPAPIAALSAAALWLTTPVGTTSDPQTVTLTNAGAASLTNINISVGVPGRSSPFAQTNDCPVTLAPGASCTILVTYTAATTTAQFDSITITDNLARSSAVHLTGATSPDPVTMSPAGLDFGSQPIGSISAPQTVTFTMGGGGDPGVWAVLVEGDDYQDFHATQSCNTGGVPPSCTVSVTFTPTLAGRRSAVIHVKDGTGRTQNEYFTVTGTAIPASG